VLGLSAVIGALAYGILIRLFGFVELTIGSLALIAAACMLAAFVAFFTLAHSHSLGRWWLAVLWWFAFSGGLWFCDRRRNAVPRTAAIPA
jgi:MFS-type transporter involved in bile tolerance (Atg22 family)